MKKMSEILSLAWCVALLPPIWAVLAPHLNIKTGAVALICASLYVAKGNKREDAWKITIGFLCGDIWAVIALEIMEAVNGQADVEVFVTLFVLGGAAVIISGIWSRWIYTASWLCGWAIGLTILSEISPAEVLLYAMQIAVAMLAGVWYVGVFVDYVQRKILEKINMDNMNTEKKDKYVKCYK